MLKGNWGLRVLLEKQTETLGEARLLQPMCVCVCVYVRSSSKDLVMLSEV